jgi:hypothetical protein
VIVSPLAEITVAPNTGVLKLESSMLLTTMVLPAETGRGVLVTIVATFDCRPLCVTFALAPTAAGGAVGAMTPASGSASLGVPSTGQPGAVTFVPVLL